MSNDLGPVMSAAERINAALAAIETAKAKQKEADERIAADSKEYRELNKTNLQKGREDGAMLQEQKVAAGHGNFGKYLKANHPDVKHRTADDYMELAEWWDRIEVNSQQSGGAAILSIRDAKRLIKELKSIDLRQQDAEAWAKTEAAKKANAAAKAERQTNKQTKAEPPPFPAEFMTLLGAAEPEDVVRALSTVWCREKFKGIFDEVALLLERTKPSTGQMIISLLQRGAATIVSGAPTA